LKKKAEADLDSGKKLRPSPKVNGRRKKAAAITEDLKEGGRAVKGSNREEEGIPKKRLDYPCQVGVGRLP